MPNDASADLDMRLMRLHQDLKATREVVEILRKEIIKLMRRVDALEHPDAPAAA